VTVLAAIRPDSWNFPLLLHVLGAMLLVGTLVLATSALILAWRNGEAAMVRLGYRSLLLGVLPSLIVMRVGAGLIASKEHLDNSNATWIGIGFTTADGGTVLLIVAIVLAALATRRTARAEGSSKLGRASAVLASLLLVAYLVTVWAMAAKPS
jgi:uncharacterized membrane protein YidH (DUF202 family)